MSPTTFTRVTMAAFPAAFALAASLALATSPANGRFFARQESPAGSIGDRWIHVRVEETGEKPESIRINFPIDLIEKIAPAFQDERFRSGKVKLGDKTLESVDLRALWKAVKEAGDAEFVTVEGTDGNIRVAREGGYLLVKVQEGGREEGTGPGDDGGKVDARLPLDVMDALLSGEKDELNVLAALRALARHEGELVSVNDEHSTVRIWIDGANDGK